MPKRFIPVFTLALLTIASVTSEAAPEPGTDDTPLVAQSDAQDAGRFYTVQFSTFKTKARAALLMTKLKGRGIDVFESKVTYRGRSFYRVCAGTFSTPDTALEYLKSYARAAHFKDVFVQSVKGSSVSDERPGPSADELAQRRVPDRNIK